MIGGNGNNDIVNTGWDQERIEKIHREINFII